MSKPTTNDQNHTTDGDRTPFLCDICRRLVQTAGREQMVAPNFLESLLESTHRANYKAAFSGLLQYSTVEDAVDSLVKIDQLFHYFWRVKDLNGSLLVQKLALTGKLNSRWSGKRDVALIFEEWLKTH